MIAGVGIGLVFAAGAILTFAGLTATTPVTPQRVSRYANIEADKPASRFKAGHAVIGLVTGLVLLVLTRWPVLAAAGFAAGFLLPRLLSAGDGSVAGFATKTDAIATWLESLRDLMSSGRLIEGALVETALRSAPVLREDLAEMVLEVEHGVPLREAMIRLSERLAHPISDKAIAAIVLALDRDATKITDVISELASSARDQAIDMVKVHAVRQSSRTQLRLVIAVMTILLVSLMVFFGDFLTFYDTAVGQMVLAVALVFLAACLYWIYRISQLATPSRLIRPGRDT